jgi:hypothetical protein
LEEIKAWRGEKEKGKGNARIWRVKKGKKIQLHNSGRYTLNLVHEHRPSKIAEQLGSKG